MQNILLYFPSSTVFSCDPIQTQQWPFRRADVITAGERAESESRDEGDPAAALLT